MTPTPESAQDNEKPVAISEKTLDDVFVEMLPELRRLLSWILQRERSDSLRTTGLVHEVYLKLAHAEVFAHLCKPQRMAIAARMARRVLVDAARRRLSGKRGGGLERVTFRDPAAPGSADKQVDVLAVNAVLDELAKIDPEGVRILEMRFFAEMTVDEIRDVLGVSKATAERRLRALLAWLATELQSADD